MVKSMTAFGRVQKKFPKFNIVVELQSVNRKHLDIHCQMQKDLAVFENDVRSAVSEKISRGQITICCHVSYTQDPPCEVHVQLPVAKKLKKALSELLTSLDIQGALTPDLLLSFFQREGIVQIQHSLQADATLKKAIVETVEAAVIELNKMKEREGKYLKKEFMQRLKTMKKQLATIQKRLPHLVDQYKKRLQKLSMGVSDESDLIAKHVASFADKVDIAEEISRFSYHIDHITEVLSKSDSSGKLIEFVLQELLREANTIGSKAQEAVISKNIILIKNEIEKMREQVQNVE